MLNKKIGGRRHREWAWALVVVALCTAAVAMWGSQEPMGTTPGSTVGGANQGSTQGSSKPAATDNSVAGVIARLPEASAFNSYMVANGIPGTLTGGTYTIFVPSNSAFATLPKGTVSGLSPAAQKRLVQYHVVAGKALDTDAVSSGTYQALSRDTLNFSVNLQTGASYVNSGKILSQHKATNGIVYIVSSVLFPPKQ